MPSAPAPIRIGVYGVEEVEPGRGVGLWAAGTAGCLTYAGATPVVMNPEPEQDWDDLFADVEGVVFTGFPTTTSRELAEQESMCLWCHNRRLPMLATDSGLLIMNGAFGGNSFTDLPRELPDALQHRHRPEKGVRHAINVECKTLLSDVYGEGEIIVNSEHRQAINIVANGFFISARALDGVVEGIEWNNDDWLAIGVQWQPASSTASGLDIQLFRAFVEGCSAVTAKRSHRRLAAVA